MALPSAFLGAKAFKKAAPGTTGTNSDSQWMHTFRTVPDIGTSFFVFVNSSVSAAINKMNTKKWPRLIGARG
jgi:hypothetical protein